MDQHNIFECGGFYFVHNFDSGNLGHVERVPTELIAPKTNQKSNVAESVDYEFNIWTRPDCAGTEFENGNRTWFYFGIQPAEPKVMVRLNIINLNKQGKMYNQGMAPVTRTLPGKPQWERIKDRPIHSTDDNTFTLSFKYRTADNVKATTFFAFTYPFSFAELQLTLNAIDLKMLPLTNKPSSPDEIYYCRECLIYSLEGRRVDLLTISSYHGITHEREERLKNLFPDKQDRPFKFQNKKIIFVSARVHPGETPSSFVFNGFLNLLLTRNDPIATQLRKHYVFKMIPFLNPDGVARGHYRTDTRGVNLNRVYLNPTLVHHPTVYASRALIRYYHYGSEKEDDFDDCKSLTSKSIQNITERSDIIEVKAKKKSPIPFKAELKHDKSPRITSNKSNTTIKAPSVDNTKEKSGETCLVEQVGGMKLTEMPSQISDSVSNVLESSSHLNDDVLRSCLGSNIHLSTSEEINIQGNNPLRPLRDALKNSISLLMDSNIVDGSTAGPGGRSVKERGDKIKMGWCKECGHSAGMGSSHSTMQGGGPTYHSIEEYREHQRQLLNSKNELETVDAEANQKGTLYLCTNCFKRYTISEESEEVQLSDVISHMSEDISGDSGSTHEQLMTRVVSGSTGDAALNTNETPTPLLKEDKTKPPKAPVPKKKSLPSQNNNNSTSKAYKEPESGLFLYIDLHGHASKKGIFMYGNHFDDLESSVECMLLPRIMSLNDLNFHFSSCNFTERNMYLKDRRDGMSREGSGRVAVFKATGLVRSYTLECNYNTGRLVNVLPPAVRDGPGAQPITSGQPTPPKYTPHIFEEVGRSLGASILDLTGQHPNSRIPGSEHRTLGAVREWLRAHSRTIRPQLTVSRLRPKATSPTRVPLYSKKGKVTEERKENTYAGAKTDTERKHSPPVFAHRSGHDLININIKFAKKNEPVRSSSKTRYLRENDPKPKTLSNKRRNVLSIRKPNTSKPQVSGVVKAKISRRSVDDSESRSLMSSKISKRAFSRGIRGAVTRSENRCRAMASSSSEDVITETWEELACGTVLGTQTSQADFVASKRRSFPNSPSRLKKIRLKSAL